MKHPEGHRKTSLSYKIKEFGDGIQLAFPK